MKMKTKHPIQMLWSLATVAGLILASQLTHAKPPLQEQVVGGASAESKNQRTQAPSKQSSSLKDRLNPQNQFEDKSSASRPQGGTKAVTKDLMEIDGNSNGGGGHFCKSMVQRYYQNIQTVFDNDASLASRYPIWRTLKRVLDPIQNPGFVIKITQSPIQGCPNTENALACGRPRQKMIEIYCGENGWNSLEREEKYKQLLHELHWWQKGLDDTNYFYSAPMAKDVFEQIKKASLGMQSGLRLDQGKLQSVETMLNKIQCEASADYRADKWEDVDGQMTCVEQKAEHWTSQCRLTCKMYYSVIMNRMASFETMDQQVSYVPVGQTLSEAQALGVADVRNSLYAKKSLEWFESLGNINAGYIYAEGPRGQRTCYSRVLDVAYDSLSGMASLLRFNKISTHCPEHMQRQ